MKIGWLTNMAMKPGEKYAIIHTDTTTNSPLSTSNMNGPATPDEISAQDQPLKKDVKNKFYIVDGKKMGPDEFKNYMKRYDEVEYTTQHKRPTKKGKYIGEGGPYSEYDAQSSEIWKSFSDFVTKGIPPTQAMMEILDKHDWASQTAERSTAIKRVEPSKSAWGAIGTIPFDWNPSNEYSFWNHGGADLVMAKVLAPIFNNALSLYSEQGTDADTLSKSWLRAGQMMVDDAGPGRGIGEARIGSEVLNHLKESGLDVWDWEEDKLGGAGERMFQTWGGKNVLLNMLANAVELTTGGKLRTAKNVAVGTGRWLGKKIPALGSAAAEVGNRFPKIAGMAGNFLLKGLTIGTPMYVAANSMKDAKKGFIIPPKKDATPPDDEGGGGGGGGGLEEDLKSEGIQIDPETGMPYIPGQPVPEAEPTEEEAKEAGDILGGTASLMGVERQFEQLSPVSQAGIVTALGIAGASYLRRYTGPLFPLIRNAMKNNPRMAATFNSIVPMMLHDEEMNMRRVNEISRESKDASRDSIAEEIVKQEGQ